MSTTALHTWADELESSEPQLDRCTVLSGTLKFPQWHHMLMGFRFPSCHHEIPQCSQWHMWKEIAARPHARPCCSCQSTVWIIAIYIRTSWPPDVQPKLRMRSVDGRGSRCEISGLWGQSQHKCAHEPKSLSTTNSEGCECVPCPWTARATL